jgi:hypothetical protein
MPNADAIATHPQHAEAAVIREHHARADFIDIFGGYSDADHFQLSFAPVKDGCDAGAHLQTVRGSKCGAGHDLALPGGARIVSVQQEERVCHWHAGGRQGNQPQGGGLAEAWHIAGHVAHDPRLNAPDA